MEKIFEELGNERVAFLAISLDHDTSRVKPFIDSFGYSFTTLYGTNEVKQMYKVGPIPTTFLIDKEGNIRRVYVGFFKNDPAKIKTFILKLIAE